MGTVLISVADYIYWILGRILHLTKNGWRKLIVAFGVILVICAVGMTFSPEKTLHITFTALAFLVFTASYIFVVGQLIGVLVLCSTRNDSANAGFIVAAAIVWMLWAIDIIGLAYRTPIVW